MRTSVVHRDGGVNHAGAKAPVIDEALVHVLVRDQFPLWAHLPVRRVARDGWDNRSFRLGEDMVVRLPSAAAYATQVEKEQWWLPMLAGSLSCPIPTPLGLGMPACGYPWPWSIYSWLDGENVEPTSAANSSVFAADIAAFLAELHGIDPIGGPQPGPHNFYRGGPLSTYDAQVRDSIERLDTQIDGGAVTEVWEAALSTARHGSPIWVHGDISLGNLLALDGRLAGVLDFGSLAIGDPACDLSIAWTVFRGEARETFRAGLCFDAGTWLRARAWALWKGLIVAARLADTNAAEWTNPLSVIGDVLGEGSIDG
jgi:aminoglycoside phosphotransferase (APT) family kinase protein